VSGIRAIEAAGVRVSRGRRAGNLEALGATEGYVEVLDLLWRSLTLLGTGALLGFAVNAVRNDGVSLTNFEAPATCAGPAEAEQSPVRLVTQAEAAQLCAQSTTLIADARSAAAYAEGHVAGAIHLPCSASDQVAHAAELSLGESRMLLVYGDETEDAWPVAEQMRRRLTGSLAVGVLEGGYRAWLSAGLACSSGSCETCGGPEHGGEAQ
jgi:3-mercaptopyruvate sulfurtransferase SseA